MQRLFRSVRTLRFIHSRARQCLLNHASASHFLRKIRNLPDESKRDALAHSHVARIRPDVPRQNLQQRRFTRAIWPDQPDAIALRNGE